MCSSSSRPVWTYPLRLKSRPSAITPVAAAAVDMKGAIFTCWELYPLMCATHTSLMSLPAYEQRGMSEPTEDRELVDMTSEK